MGRGIVPCRALLILSTLQVMMSLPELLCIEKMRAGIRVFVTRSIGHARVIQTITTSSMK